MLAIHPNGCWGRAAEVPETFAQYYPEFADLRQLVIRPYRVVYEPTQTTCDILGVMRCSHLIGRASLGLRD